MKSQYEIAKAQIKLEDKGYLVFVVIGVEGLWNLIAVGDTHVRFIQVSCVPLYRRGVAYKRELKEFPLLANTSKEYWYYEDGYFKEKFLSDGVERDNGAFYGLIKRSRPKPLPRQPLTKIEANGELPVDLTIPF